MLKSNIIQKKTQKKTQKKNPTKPHYFYNNFIANQENLETKTMQNREKL